MDQWFKKLVVVVCMGAAAFYSLWMIDGIYSGTITKPFTFSAGSTIRSSDMNSNFDTIYNEFNGSITNANVSATAGIAESKIDDDSATVAAMRTTVDPAESGTESQATSIQGEIERLRFAIYEIKKAIDSTVLYWYQTGGATSGNVAVKNAANAFAANNTYVAGDITSADISDGTIIDADIAASGITTRSKLPSAIAYEDEANNFVGGTKFLNTTLTAENLATNEGGQIFFERVAGGVLQSSIYLDMISNSFRAVMDSTTKFAWDLGPNPGVLTAGTVPLARLSASDANSGYPQSGTGGETLRTIRGKFLAGSSVSGTVGTGFTPTRTGVGTYNIDFTTDFASEAVCTWSGVSLGASASSSYGFSLTSLSASALAVDKRRFSDYTVSDDAVTFEFICTGPA
jgi:hypothetical protein